MENKPLRFVVDTNVIISASISKKPTTTLSAYHRALALGVILSSDAIAEELARVILDKKFDRYVSKEERIGFVEDFRKSVVVIHPTETITACRDPKDDKFLELAASGKATCIITGDEDLLDLHPFREIPILTPAVFLETSFDPPHTP